MNAQQVKQNFDLVGYISVLVKLRKSGAYYIGACPICGGRDRFQIKRAEGDMWICRKCAPQKYHSAIDFVMQYHKLDYKEAVKRMGRELDQRRPLGQARPTAKPAPIQVVPDGTWQAQAWKQIDAACSRLTGGEAGEAGRRYLTHRGISRGSMFMNSLGYAIVYKRPAIVIPYLDVGDLVTAVKYRFIDELAQTNKGKRFAMLGGSLPYLFGLQHTLPTDQALLFVEGEVNAISILQTLPRGVSVVSAGSESNGNAALLQALAAYYSRVVIWMDDPAKAAEKRANMKRPDAKLLKSPIIHGKKWDANEMLQVGLLMDFVTRQFSVTCEGILAPALVGAEIQT